MGREHHFVAHFRLAVDYEKGIKNDMGANGNQDKFLAGAENFYSSVSQIVLSEQPSREELEFVYQRASVFLEEANFYPGIVVAVLVRKLDDWLVFHEESYWNKSLWTRFQAMF